MVEKKWKPIWAEREHRAEKEAEAHPDAERQLAESNGEQGVEAGKRISDKPTDKSLLPKFSDRLCSGVDQLIQNTPSTFITTATTGLNTNTGILQWFQLTTVKNCTRAIRNSHLHLTMCLPLKPTSRGFPHLFRRNSANKNSMRIDWTTTTAKKCAKR